MGSRDLLRDMEVSQHVGALAASPVDGCKSVVGGARWYLLKCTRAPWQAGQQRRRAEAVRRGGDAAGGQRPAVLGRPAGGDGGADGGQGAASALVSPDPELDGTLGFWFSITTVCVLTPSSRPDPESDPRTRPEWPHSCAQLVVTIAEHHFNAGDATGVLVGLLLSGFLAWGLWRGEHIQVIKVRS